MKIKNIIYYIAITVIAYHFLAIFGIIAAILLPFIWLYSPNLVARIHIGLNRIARRKTLVNSNTKPRLAKIFLVSLIIVLISNISILLVYFESKYFFNYDYTEILSLFSPSKTELTIEKNSSKSNDIEDVYDIFVSSDKAINLIQADMRFNTEAIIIVDIELDKSFANIVLKKEFSVVNGKVNIIVGIPNPGFIGKGLLAQIKVINSGSKTSYIDFLSSSKILANDGDGTDLAFKVLGTSIEIK